MQKIIVTVGVSCSGKSTWATDFIKKNKGWVRVNRDNLREELTGLKASIYNKSPKSSVEKQINDVQHEQIRYFLSKGMNVIIDNTHLKEKYINEILSKYQHLADIELKWFYTNVLTARKYCSMRDFEGEVLATNNFPCDSTNYIERQHGEFDILRKQIVIDYYNQTNYIVAQNKALPHAIICDLDGTLAEAPRSSGTWQFDRDYTKDLVIEPVQNLLLSLEDQYRIVFVSGREDKYKQMTEDFLYKAGIFKYELFMRKTGDNRRDSVVKCELFKENIQDKYYVQFCLDDRISVIEECWEKLGLFTKCVNQGRQRY